ncbi:ORF125 [Ranid herpesvirus 2]|uniref:ORF125 n=1 Tax=Ranid herpesvirus 2 TaxID=389214 RepID=Q14VY1_9VIRU|nr:ORF125 [Ranid herpesvirus 2]ABG25608.1 ORF125 [Ranid herpesvirus 2]
MITIPHINGLLRGTGCIPGNLANEDLLTVITNWMHCYLHDLPVNTEKDAHVISSIIAHVFFPCQARATFNELLSYNSLVSALTPGVYVAQKIKKVPDCRKPLHWLVLEDDEANPSDFRSVQVVHYTKNNKNECLIMPCFRLCSEQWKRVQALNQVEGITFIPHNTVFTVVGNNLRCTNADKRFSYTKPLGSLTPYKSCPVTPLLDGLADVIQEMKLDISGVKLPSCAGWHSTPHLAMIKKYMGFNEFNVDSMDYKQMEALSIACCLKNKVPKLLSADRVLSEFLKNPERSENVTPDMALVLLGLKYTTRLPQMLVHMCHSLLPEHKNKLQEVLRVAHLSPMALFSSEQGVRTKRTKAVRRARPAKQLNTSWIRGMARRSKKFKYDNTPTIRNKPNLPPVVVAAAAATPVTEEEEMEEEEEEEDDEEYDEFDLGA